MSNTNGVISTVKVVKSRPKADGTGGKVINVSTRNPLEGWVMLQSSSKVWKGGREFENIRTGFARNTIAKLEAMGFAEGKEFPGHIVIQDSFTPIMKDNADFGLRIPQSKQGVAYTAAIGTAIRTACATAGITYEGVDDQGEMHPIYRKVFYSPYPEGHALYEADVIIPIANTEKVNTFIASIALPVGAGADAGMNTAKVARLAELKAIPKAQRTAKDKSDLAELIEELEG